VNTSDAGSDQASACRLLSLALDPTRAGVVGQLCFQHQIHLAVQKSLSRTSKVRYWARLAMVCSLWRSSGGVHKMRQRFAALFGEAVAARCSSSPPPAPLRGRWGSVHSSESFLLKCEWTQLRTVSRAQWFCCGPLHGKEISGDVRCGNPEPRAMTEMADLVAARSLPYGTGGGWGDGEGASLLGRDTCRQRCCIGSPAPPPSCA
jgi:hypothetical protein